MKYIFDFMFKSYIWFKLSFNTWLQKVLWILDNLQGGHYQVRQYMRSVVSYLAPWWPPSCPGAVAAHWSLLYRPPGVQCTVYSRTVCSCSDPLVLCCCCTQISLPTAGRSARPHPGERSVQSAVCSMQCAVCGVRCAVSSVQYAVFGVLCALLLCSVASAEVRPDRRT